MEPKRSRLLFAGFLAAAAALLLFGWLADQILHGQQLHFDAWVREGVHAWASPAFTAFMRAITQLGAPWFLVATSAFLIWRLLEIGRPRAAILLLVAVLGAEFLDVLLKLVFHRRRPEAFFDYPEPSGYSFPSGHAITAACFYGVFAAILSARFPSRWKKAFTWIAAALIAGLVGFSRIYLGVHYPTDVVAGYAAAIVWVASLRASYHVWMRRRPVN